MTDKNSVLSFYMLKLGLLAPVMNDAFFLSVFIFDILAKKSSSWSCIDCYLGALFFSLDCVSVSFDSPVMGG